MSAQHSGSTWVGYVLGSQAESSFLGEYYRAWHPGLAVPCTACAAQGRTVCEVLHDIEDVPVERAFAFAFERTGRRVLIDTSKTIDWAAQAASGMQSHDVRLVHVVRDPRGWLASDRRRFPDVATIDLLRKWHEVNLRISQFAKDSGLAYRAVFYDDLASQPLAGFGELAAFCGMTFHRDSLKYWNVRHHGFAANGATSPLLQDAPVRARVGHFLTRDDAFYEQHDRTSFLDDRWKSQLATAEQQLVLTHPETRDLLMTFGRRMVSGGLAPAGVMASRPVRTLARAWTALTGAEG